MTSRFGDGAFQVSRVVGPMTSPIQFRGTRRSGFLRFRDDIYECGVGRVEGIHMDDDRNVLRERGVSRDLELDLRFAPAGIHLFRADPYTRRLSAAQQRPHELDRASLHGVGQSRAPQPRA